MQLICNRNGISLVELVIAVFLVASVVAGLSLAFPKASENAARTQQRSIAANLALAQIQTLKSSPYAFMDVTDAATPPGQFNALCDCSSIADLSVLSSTGTAMAGTTFQTASCVHFVSPGSPWTSQCSTDGDTGYKHIVVYVSWTNGSQTYSISQESMMNR